MGTAKKDRTPVSDAIAALVEREDEAAFAHFVQVFLSEESGVIAMGVREGVKGQISGRDAAISLGATGHPDGNERILAFADPFVFAARFGQPFNALMDGRQILEVALSKPEGHGVLVNSALEEVSIPIGREYIAELVRGTGFDNPSG